LVCSFFKYRKRFGSEMAWAIRTEGDRAGGGSEYRNKLWRVTTYTEANGRMCEGDRVSSGGQGMVEVKLLCLGCCLPSLSLCRNGFHDLLRVRPCSSFKSCACTSGSIQIIYGNFSRWHRPKHTKAWMHSLKVFVNYLAPKDDFSCRDAMPRRPNVAYVCHKKEHAQSFKSFFFTQYTWCLNLAPEGQ